MEDGNHNDDIGFHEKEHLIRESPRQSPASIAVDHRVLKWIAKDRIYGRIDRHKQIRTEAGNAAFVPVEGFCEFRLSFGSNDQPIRHLRLAILSRTTGQGTPAVGSLR